MPLPALLAALGSSTGLLTFGALLTSGTILGATLGSAAIGAKTTVETAKITSDATVETTGIVADSGKDQANIWADNAIQSAQIYAQSTQDTNQALYQQALLQNEQTKMISQYGLAGTLATTQAFTANPFTMNLGGFEPSAGESLSTTPASFTPATSTYDPLSEFFNPPKS